MTLTRRVFLRVGIIAGITTVAPFASGNAFGQKVGGGNSGSDNSPFINTDLLNYVTASTFEEYVNTSFSIRTDALTEQKVELIEVRVIEKSGRLYGFSLLFSSDSEAILPQASYLFEHEKMGVFPLFIVPVKTPKGMRYEAVFNRLREAETKDSN
ncbi:MAG: hypothetical protein WBV94_07645 [Blastocatellia bacterium]